MCGVWACEEGGGVKEEMVGRCVVHCRRNQEDEYFHFNHNTSCPHTPGYAWRKWQYNCTLCTWSVSGPEQGAEVEGGVYMYGPAYVDGLITSQL